MLKTTLRQVNFSKHWLKHTITEFFIAGFHLPLSAIFIFHTVTQRHRCHDELFHDSNGKLCLSNEAAFLSHHKSMHTKHLHIISCMDVPKMSVPFKRTPFALTLKQELDATSRKRWAAHSTNAIEAGPRSAVQHLTSQKKSADACSLTFWKSTLRPNSTSSNGHSHLCNSTWDCSCVTPSSGWEVVVLTPI